jgi:putative ABC transport system permease protein
MLNDIRHACRVLQKAPGFTIAAAIVLALGIGANTVIFSVVNGVLLHPLRYSHADRLAVIFSESPKKNLRKWPASHVDLVDWRAQSRSFEQIAGLEQTDLNLTSTSEPERLDGARVTANFFTMLGVNPALGRTFAPGEDHDGRDNVVVLSNGLWKRLFGSDSKIIGRVLTLNGTDCTIIGVMPAEFRPVESEEIWRPLVLHADSEARGHRGTTVFARLKPGIGFEQANADLRQVASRIAAANPKTNQDLVARATPWEEEQVADLRQLIVLLWGAVAFVLLIACANVANLLLARTSVRRLEIAIRLALGAGRFRIFRQLLTESVLLALLGGAVAILPALWGVDLLCSLIDDPQAPTYIKVDGAVMAFNAVIALLTGIVFGVVPAFWSTRAGVSESLKQGGNKGLLTSWKRTRSLLVVGEVALSMLLLSGAGLMMESISKLRAVKTGFDPAGVLTMRTALPQKQYADRNSQILFYRQLLEKVGAVPGVKAAGVTSILPMSDDDSAGSIRIAGRSGGTTVADVNLVSIRSVSADYFRTMGVALFKGRYIDSHDTEKTAPVAMISEKAAQQYWPGENPVGQQFKIETRTPEDDRWKTIVGVVASIRHSGPTQPVKPELYVPYTQSPRLAMSLVVKTPGDPSKLAPALRRVVASVDAKQPVYNVRTMTRIVNASINTEHVTSVLLGIFAGLALLLASTGLYGVMSYLVAQRTREIGVRVALGARRQDIMRLVIDRGARLVGTGLAIGIALAIATATVASDALFGVAPTNPVVLTIAAAILVSVSLIANYIPALRATRVEPATALREE